MTYQQILNIHFDRRKSLNPSYSLRAFARFLKMQPSKLSEVFNLKKGISLMKAREICTLLKLSDEDREIFECSVLAQHARGQRERSLASAKLSILLDKEVKSAQRNAWYFGAVEFLLSLGIKKNEELSRFLGIKDLQVENAKRYLKRVKKLHPEITEISYEPESLMKKLTDAFVSRQDQVNFESEFLYMNKNEFKRLLKSIKKSCRKNKEINPNRDVYMLTFVSQKLINGDEIC